MGRSQTQGEEHMIEIMEDLMGLFAVCMILLIYFK